MNKRFLLGLVLIFIGVNALYLFWVESFNNSAEVHRSLNKDGLALDGAFAFFGELAFMGAYGLILGNYCICSSRGTQ